MDIAWLANHPLLTVAANLTGIVGFCLAIFFYLRGKERFALSYTVVEKFLIQPDTLRPFDMNVPLNWKGQGSFTPHTFLYSHLQLRQQID